MRLRSPHARRASLRVRLSLTALLLIFVLASCMAPSGAETDDAGPRDAGPADFDAGPGSGPDAGPDGGSSDTDAGSNHDAGSDAGSATDAGSDAGSDEGSDAGSGSDCGSDGPSVSCATCTGSAGSVVELNGFQSTAAPAAPLSRTDGARVLLFSDSPETPTTSGLLFSADVAAGPARIVLYHVNGFSGGDKKVSVVIDNPGAAALTAHIERFAVPAPSAQYVEQGQAAVRAFLGADNAADKNVAAGGAALLLVESLDGVRVPPDELVHGIIDVTFTAPASVRVVMLDAGTDTLASWADLPALPRDVHDRGTFDGADRTLALAGCVWPAGAQRVRLGADTALLPDPLGIDELTGTAERLAGHYGSLVRIELPAAATSRALVLVPRAGAYAGAARVTVGGAAPVVVDAPAAGVLADNTAGALLGRLPVDTAGAVEVMPAGGSNLPVDLLVIPVD